MNEKLIPVDRPIGTTEMFIGVYVLTHVASGKKYIGSSGNVGTRLSSHKSLLAKGKHHCIELQELYNSDNRYYSVVYETLDREAAFDLEQALVDEYWGTPKLLNVAKDVRVSARGVPATEANRIQCGELNRGKPLSPEHAAKISASNKGKVMTAEHRKNIGDSRRGKPLSPEGRATLDANNLARRTYVYCDGQIYHGTREAGVALGKDHGLIGYRARSKQPRWANWYYCDKDGNPK